MVMEGYTFHDIFASKNIDYLLAVISLLVLIPFWKTLANSKKSSDQGGKYYHASKTGKN